MKDAADIVEFKSLMMKTKVTADDIYKLISKCYVEQDV